LLHFALLLCLPEGGKAAATKRLTEGDVATAMAAALQRKGGGQRAFCLLDPCRGVEEVRHLLQSAYPAVALRAAEQLLDGALGKAGEAFLLLGGAQHQRAVANAADLVEVGFKRLRIEEPGSELLLVEQLGGFDEEAWFVPYGFHVDAAENQRRHFGCRLLHQLSPQTA